MRKGYWPFTRLLKEIFITTCVLVLTALFLPLGARAENFLTPAQARQHLGEQATVCGTVANARYAVASHGQPTFLNLDQPYPHPVFTIVIWGTDCAQFGTPETTYLGKRLCVTGTIESYRETPEMIVRSTAQLLSPGPTAAVPVPRRPQGMRREDFRKRGNVHETGYPFSVQQ